jgi:hypothetical protein
MHKLAASCICSLSRCVTIVIASSIAIRKSCFHDVFTIPMCVEGACQEEEEPSHHHVAI